jgi:type II secretory pathway predicted ATPase ExeA/TolA-binding protein
LSVVLGDVGTGKTTLCRKLMQVLMNDKDFVYHMVMDPSYENEEVFFRALTRDFGIEPGDGTLIGMKEAMERFLYRKGVEEGRIVVLVIDEAQKLSEMTLECLRVLLNYETNNFKLLQLVLLGQMELHSKIIGMPNFFDRVSLRYTLNPLDEEETDRMIEFRVRQAGYKGHGRLFTGDASREIHRHTMGYPRRIGMLCHQALARLITDRRQTVDADLIRDIAGVKAAPEDAVSRCVEEPARPESCAFRGEDVGEGRRRRSVPRLALSAALLILAAALWGRIALGWRGEAQKTLLPVAEAAVSPGVQRDDLLARMNELKTEKDELAAAIEKLRSEKAELDSLKHDLAAMMSSETQTPRRDEKTDGRTAGADPDTKNIPAGAGAGPRQDGAAGVISGKESPVSADEASSKDLHYETALRHAESGDFAEAISEFERTLQLKPAGKTAPPAETLTDNIQEMCDMLEYISEEQDDWEHEQAAGDSAAGDRGR